MLRIAVLTTGRQDWGILRTICKLGRASKRLDLRMIAGGMALSAKHGLSVRAMEEEGLAPDERAEWLGDEEDVAADTGRAVAAIGAALARLAPDALLVVGDRSETIAAGLAASVLRIPIVHLHGGEETEGAFDNVFRHALTKLSHLHLVSHEEHARRVRALAEDPKTIHVVGAPGLDAIVHAKHPSRAELEAHIGLALEPPVVIVTLHPATLGGDPAAEARCIAETMDAVHATYVITLPNNDPGNAPIREVLSDAGKAPRRVAVEALGKFYGGLMAVADAMLGNSSSALVEAPSMALPAVNIGARQAGRLRGPNVLDVPDASTVETTNALRRALDPAFRASVADASRSLYGGGGASARVIALLEEWSPPRPPIKATFV